MVQNLLITGCFSLEDSGGGEEGEGEEEVQKDMYIREVVTVVDITELQ